MSNFKTYDTTEEMILRDYLALDRTKLANERTLLAYMRTVIGLIASGVGLIEISDMAWAHATGYILLCLIPVCLFLGIYHFVRQKIKLDKLEEK
jgi:putative membrane protein